MSSPTCDLLSGLTPADYALPSTFTSWRPIQQEAIEQAIYGPERFQALACPTGSGKSLIVMSVARITGYRTVILTGTKGLQDQYLREYGQDWRAQQVARRLGVEPTQAQSETLIDIRGKSNYRCHDNQSLTCLDGPKTGCRACGSPKCPYTATLTRARQFPIVVTNYAYWFNINRRGSGLEPVIGTKYPIDLLVLDEAHLAPEELSSFLAIRIYEREVRDLLHTACPDTDSFSGWLQFAREYATTIKLDAEEHAKKLKERGPKATRAEIDTQHKRESLSGRINQLAETPADGWVCESQTHGRAGKRWEFDPIWPGMYAGRALFRAIPHVLLLSATIRPKTLNLLGIPAAESAFREWPRIFPPHRSPVYHIPTVRMNWRTTAADMEKWVARIDEIIASRLGRKGIIHTVSYDRQAYLLAHSKFAQHMMGNTSDPSSPRASDVVHAFKRSAAPSILCSPSFSTGWDFPGSECEWQIITKIPFPHSQSKVMRARIAKDPAYLNYLAMQDLVQTCGRGMRSEHDRCETIIVDDNIGWFMGRARFLAPDWFTVRKMAQLPAPPPALCTEKVA